MKTELLAKTFSRLLQEEIGLDKLTEINELNKTVQYLSCCHSHDMCDANMVMLSAWCEVNDVPLEEADIYNQGTFEAINMAWMVAQREGFYV